MILRFLWIFLTLLFGGSFGKAGLPVYRDTSNEMRADQQEYASIQLWNRGKDINVGASTVPAATFLLSGMIGASRPVTTESFLYALMGKQKVQSDWVTDISLQELKHNPDYDYTSKIQSADVSGKMEGKMLLCLLREKGLWERITNLSLPLNETTSFVYECQGEDLFYSLQHVVCHVSRCDDNGPEMYQVILEDVYDFTEKREVHGAQGLANMINNFGVFLQDIGFVHPYDISIKILLLP